MVYCGLLWYTVVYYDILWYTVVYPPAFWRFHPYMHLFSFENFSPLFYTLLDTFTTIGVLFFDHFHMHIQKWAGLGDLVTCSDVR